MTGIGAARAEAADRRPHGPGTAPDRAAALPVRPGEPAVPDWRERAACRGADLNLFFGPRRERADQRLRRLEEAKRLCARCPVREACLDFALRSREEFGVWGGLTETERRHLLAERRRHAERPRR